MAIWKNFPYSNVHELNLDWLISNMRTLEESFNTFVETNVIKYSDPIEWSISSQYEANTIVRNEELVYLSKKAVPAGVAITNGEYWFRVGDLSAYLFQMDQLRHQITSDDEGTNVYSSKDYDLNAVFWLNGYLSKATATISTGASFVLSENYQRVTVIDLLSILSESISKLYTLAGTRKRVICIGDSIGEGYSPDGNVTGWPELLCDKLGLTLNNDFYIAVKGGAGFVNASQGANFLQTLQTLNVNSPETITDIYCVGGVNDAAMNAAYNTMVQNIGDFCDYCKMTYPNAIVHLGCIAYYQKLGGDYGARLQNVHRAFRDGCKKNARNIPALVSAMSKFSGYASDGMHVTQETENMIVNGILSETGLLYQVNGAGTPNDKVSGIMEINAQVIGTTINYWSPARTLTVYNSSLSGNIPPTSIGTVTESAILGFGFGTAATNFQQIPFNGFCKQVSDGKYYPCGGHITYYNGEQYISIQGATNTGFVGAINQLLILPLQGSVPML